MDRAELAGKRTKASGKMSKYVLEQRLGDGGMAEVFRARVEGPEGFQRACAVKRLLPDLRRDSSLQLRFIDEARIVGRLRHPCIVDVFDFYEEDGIHHLVMELVEGVSAATLIAGGAGGWFVPLPVAGTIVCETARALQHAHGQGVLHRDVSAANVLISRDGGVKLVDFGLADAVGKLSHTAPGSIAGTIEYLSPARRRGEKATREDDCFALGVVLRHLLDAADPRERGSAGGKRISELQRRLVSGAAGDWSDLLPTIRRLPLAAPEEVAVEVDRARARDRR